MSSPAAQEPSGKSGMKHRDVVSNFIFKYSGDFRQAQLALFRRSDEVRSYAGKLAPVSGSIDRTDLSPFGAAVREIKEETGLDASTQYDSKLRGYKSSAEPTAKLGIVAISKGRDGRVGVGAKSKFGTDAEKRIDGDNGTVGTPFKLSKARVDGGTQARSDGKSRLSCEDPVPVTTEPNVSNARASRRPVDEGDIPSSTRESLSAVPQPTTTVRTPMTQPRSDGHLMLHLKGRPFYIEDPAIMRSWTVYPFSWILRDPTQEFVTNWEHTDYKWVAPRDMLAGRYEHDSVPDLQKSIERVWLESDDGGIFVSNDRQHRQQLAPANALSPSKLLMACLDDLKNDHQAGAAQMASNALEMFKSIVQHLHDTAPMDNSKGAAAESFDTAWYKCRLAAWYLVYNGRESMSAAIATTLLRCLKSIDISGATSLQVVIDGIATFQSKAGHTKQLLRASFSSCLETRLDDHPSTSSLVVVTLSRSSTVESCLLDCIQRTTGGALEVRILESRPLFEGVLLGQSLLEQARAQGLECRLSIKVMADAACAKAAKSADLLLLGADRISSDGNVSNKLGSLAAALTFRHISPAGKIVVLSDTGKIAKPEKSGGAGHEDEMNDASELIASWGTQLEPEMLEDLVMDSRMTVENTYFEWITAELIDAYITERGSLSKEDVAGVSNEVEALEEEMFVDL